MNSYYSNVLLLIFFITSLAHQGYSMEGPPNQCHEIHHQQRKQPLTSDDIAQMLNEPNADPIYIKEVLRAFDEELDADRKKSDMMAQRKLLFSSIVLGQLTKMQIDQTTQSEALRMAKQLFDGFEDYLESATSRSFVEEAHEELEETTEQVIKSRLTVFYKLYFISLMTYLKELKFGHSSYRYAFPIRFPSFRNKSRYYKEWYKDYHVRSLVRQGDPFLMAMNRVEEDIIRAYQNLVANIDNLRSGRAFDFGKLNKIITDTGSVYRKYCTTIAKAFHEKLAEHAEKKYKHYEKTGQQFPCEIIAHWVPLNVEKPREIHVPNFVQLPIGPTPAAKRQAMPMMYRGQLNNPLIQHDLVIENVENLPHHNYAQEARGLKRKEPEPIENAPRSQPNVRKRRVEKITTKDNKVAYRNERGALFFGDVNKATYCGMSTRNELSNILIQLISLKTMLGDKLPDGNYSNALRTIQLIETLARENPQICLDLFVQFRDCKPNYMRYSGNPQLVLHPEQDDISLEAKYPVFVNTLVMAYKMAQQANRLLDFFINAFLPPGENTICLEAAQKVLVNWMEIESHRQARMQLEATSEKADQTTIAREVGKIILEFKATRPFVPRKDNSQNVTFDSAVQIIKSTMSTSEQQHQQQKLEEWFAKVFRAEIIEKTKTILITQKYDVSTEEIDAVITSLCLL